MHRCAHQNRFGENNLLILAVLSLGPHGVPTFAAAEGYGNVTRRRVGDADLRIRHGSFSATNRGVENAQPLEAPGAPLMQFDEDLGSPWN